MEDAAGEGEEIQVECFACTALEQALAVMISDRVEWWMIDYG